MASTTTNSITADLSPKDFEAYIGNQLSHYVKGMTSDYTCGGRLKLDAPVSVTLVGSSNDANITAKNNPVIIQVPQELRDLKLKPTDYRKMAPGSWSSDGSFERADEKRKELFAEQAADLEGLISSIPKASFGKGGETVYDTNIRDALQLKAEKFDLSLPQEKIDEILVSIKEGMGLTTDIIAEPYSLNVYQKGGKFLKHKDTPRGDDMFGTLVLCLPSWFTGGTMEVSLGDEKQTYFEYKQYGYSSSPETPRDPCEIRWAAFFADVDHEILTVEEGIRITVAYLLRRKDSASAKSIIPRALEGNEQAKMIKDAFEVGLRDKRFFPEGGKVGLPCLHLYTNEEVFGPNDDSSKALTKAQLNRLKGQDLMVANACASAGLSLRLQPYLLNENSGGCGGDWPLKKYPKELDPSDNPSDNEFELEMLYMRASDRNIERHPNTKGKSRYVNKEADLWILYHDDGAKHDLGEKQYAGDGYFGNEASQIHFYVKACLLIDVPQWSESRGITETDTKYPQTKKQKIEQQL